MPATSTLACIRIPAFSYKGFKFQESEVAGDIDSLGTNEPAYRLLGGAATLAESAMLYEIALLARMGEKVDTISEEVMRATQSIYYTVNSKTPAGAWTDDACDYSSGKRPRGVITPKDFVPVRWVKRPVLKSGSKGWKISLREESEEFYILMPPEGFVIPTIDGLYRPDTGTPFATERDRDSAVRLLERVGLCGTEEASYFWPRKENEPGARVVSHRHFNSYYGPFEIDVIAEPNFVDGRLGFRPLRQPQQRSPLGSPSPPVPT